jgi:hypothetical protein
VIYLFIGRIVFEILSQRMAKIGCRDLSFLKLIEEVILMRVLDDLAKIEFGDLLKFCDHGIIVDVYDHITYVENYGVDISGVKGLGHMVEWQVAVIW